MHSSATVIARFAPQHLGKTASLALTSLLSAFILGLGAGSSAAQAWTPPPDKPAQAAGAATKLPEVAKMPDVVGVRLGMTPQEALLALHKVYPSDHFQEMKVTWFPTTQKPDSGFNILAPDPLWTPDVYLSFTAPPNPQLVWHIVRYNHRMHTNHATLLAALRQKYGKESYAASEGGGAITDDRMIGEMIWIFDEHGNRAPLPSAQAFQGNTITFCGGRGWPAKSEPTMPTEENRVKTWCSSFTGVVVTLDPQEIVENMITDMMDLPLANRATAAYLAWQNDADAKARAAELEKSKKTKPVL
jgi:hypothetical protein